MKIELTIGVTPVSGSIASADDAALKAAALAESSAAAGTFGVGGLLVERQGRILAQAVNSVIRDGIVVDPTAHVERQLVDWYFQERSRKELPPPEEVVIISSLDPCAMCAGAILKSGLSAIAVAEDPVSGVHDNQGLPHRMPRELWPRAEKSLAMFAVKQQREGLVAEAHGVLHGAVSREAVLRCQAALQHSILRVRSRIGGSPEDLCPNVPFAKMMQLLADMRIDLPPGAFLAAPQPDSGRITNLAQLNEHLGPNGACLLNEDGQPILFAHNADGPSPIRDSILELVRIYTALRNWVSASKAILLPHPRQCSVLRRTVPESAVTALLELGALGSFLEERRFPSAFPLLATLEESDGSLEEYAASLPPFYTDEVGVTVGRLPSELLAARNS